MNRFSDSFSDFFRKTDVVLWLLTIAAVIYSLLLISSMQRSGDYNYIHPQRTAVIIGIAAAVFISFADYRFIIKKWYIALVVGLILAALVFAFGIRVSGTDDTAWIELPGGYTFQPSEFIKICFIITFSKHLSFLIEKKIIRSLPGVLSLLGHALIPMAIIHMQGDDGTVLIFALMFIIMAFVAGFLAARC